MSKPLIGIVAGIAVLLGVIVLVTLPGGSGASPGNGDEAGSGERDTTGGAAARDDVNATNEAASTRGGVAFAIEPAMVRAITVRLPGEEAATVTRLESGAWVFAEGDEPSEAGWPADGRQALAVLASLESVRSVGEAADGPGDEAGKATFHMRGVGERELAFATRGVGGNVVIEAASGPALVRREAVASLMEPGLASWRSQSALPGVGPGQTSRLELETAGKRLSLMRMGGEWMLRSPVAARANQDAVNSLLRLIGGLRAERFLDGPAPDSAFLGERLVVRAERDARSADGVVTTTGRSIEIGESAPFGLGVRFARTDLDTSTGPGDANDRTYGVTVSLQDAPAFEQLASARTYLAKSAAAVRPDDVHFVTIAPLETAGDEAPRERSFRRNLGEWFTMRADGTGEALSAIEMDELGRLLNLVSNRAGEPYPEEEAPGFRPLRRVELHDVYGEVVERLTVGFAGAGTPAVAGGGVIWLYPDQQRLPEVLDAPRYADLAPVEERAEPDVDPNERSDTK